MKEAPAIPTSLLSHHVGITLRSSAVFLLAFSTPMDRIKTLIIESTSTQVDMIVAGAVQLLLDEDRKRLVLCTNTVSRTLPFHGEFSTVKGAQMEVSL